VALTLVRSAMGAMRFPVLSSLVKASVAGFAFAVAAVAAGADVVSRAELDGVPTLTVQGDSSVRLLQINGAVDHELTCFLSLPEPGVPFDQLRFTDSSTGSEVLATDGSGSLLSKQVHSTWKNGNVRGLNLTANLDFDEFVGRTVYGIEVSQVDPDTRAATSLVSTSSDYLIAGTTVFSRESSVTASGATEDKRTICSGAGRELSVPYTKLTGQLNPDGSYKGPSTLDLYMQTQYLDGSVVTTPAGLGQGKGGRSPADYARMDMSLASFEGQIVHNVDSCKPAEGSYDNDAGGFVLPEHCGVAYYTAPSGEPGFGLAVEPYRAGKLEFGLEWADFTADDRDFMDEAWTSTVTIDVTGTPPPVITKVSPTYDFRQAGGETLLVDMYNADNSLGRECSVQSTDGNGSVTDIVFGEEAGSFEKFDFPTFSESATFVTGAGVGRELDFSVAVARPDGLGSTETVQAVFFPGYHYDFSYDPQVVRIDSMSPNKGLESGGTPVTLSGYFPHFDVARGDSILFDGAVIPGSYVMSSNETSITFALPPRAEMGRNYIYAVSVQIGFEMSAALDFRYITESASASMLYTGTSLRDGRQEIGRCNSARFTAQVLPATAEATNYTWSLTRNGDASKTNLLDSENLFEAMYVDINSADLPQVGDYTLTVTIHLAAVQVTTSLPLRRTDTLTIGVFLHTPTARAISIPEAPLRLSAMVEPPGCGSIGDVEELMFEWTFMDKVTTFSYHSAVESNQAQANIESPARLGWEYVVPQVDLEYGNHVVNLKVYSAVDESINGMAATYALIQKADLVPVIRTGESRMDVTKASTLDMTAGRSYDPDVTYPQLPTANITYSWACVTASKATFESQTACDERLLPSNTTEAFTVPRQTLQALGAEQAFIRYSLTVTKADRVSQTAQLLVAVVDDSRPAVTDYEIVVRSVLGEPLDASAIKYYEPVVIDVAGNTDGLSWTYSLVSPADTRFFFFSSNLISDQGYYNPDSQSTIGNRYPLGIRANALAARMTYVFRIDFEKVGFQTEPVFVTLSTREQPTLRFETPQITEGTTSSVFSLNAAPSFVDPSFAYYFVLTEAGGGESSLRVCVGGCTGYPFVNMRIGLAGNYTLTALLYDTQGTAQLAADSLSTVIVVKDSDVTDRYRSELQVLFHQGDDNTWTSLANDLAFMLSDDYESEEALSAVRRMAAAHSMWELERSLLPRGSVAGVGQLGGLVRAATDDVSTLAISSPVGVTPTPALTDEDVSTFVKSTVYDLITGSKDIFCNAFPNTLHSEQCIMLVQSLATQKCIDVDGVYRLLHVVKCCGENVPEHTAYSLMAKTLPDVFFKLNKVSVNEQCHVVSHRRRLLAEEEKPNNLAADVHLAFMQAGTGAMVNGKGAGHTDIMTVAPATQSVRRQRSVSAGVDAAALLADAGVNTTLVTARESFGDSIVPGSVTTTKMGHGTLTVAVASNSEQLPQLSVEGKSTTLKGIQGRGKNNFFYMKPQCFDKVFSPAGDETVIFSYYQAPNFVVRSGFQAPPVLGQTSEGLHWTVLYQPHVTTKLREMKVDNEEDACFCWRMEMTDTSGLVGDLEPGAYTFKQLKQYGVDVGRGAAYQYDELPVHIEGSSVEEKWVEACMTQPGLVGTAPTARIAFFGSTFLAGFNSLAVVGIVLGALLLVVVAMAGAWLVASRVAVVAAAPPRALGVGEVFVDRDIWGRSTAPVPTSPSSPQ